MASPVRVEAADLKREGTTMEKGKGEGGRREAVKEESMPYRSRLISLQLDEHMFRGPGEFAENSLIRLFSNDRLAAQIKNPGLVWIFKDWKVVTGHNKITNWRSLIAVCYNTNTKQVKEIESYYQQWGLATINAHSIGVTDYTTSPSSDIPNATKDIADSVMDLIETIVGAREGTDQTKWDEKMGRQNGEELCDRLNLYWRKP